MKIKDKDRFIAKLVATALLTASVAGIGGGVALCHNSVEDSKVKPGDEYKYAAGIVAMSIGSGALSLGMAAYPFDTPKKKEDNNTDEQTNNNERGL